MFRIDRFNLGRDNNNIKVTNAEVRTRTGQQSMVSIAVFSGAVEIFFGPRWLSLSTAKIGPCAYGLNKT